VFTESYDLNHSLEFRAIVVPREIYRERVARAFETCHFNITMGHAC